MGTGQKNKISSVLKISVHKTEYLSPTNAHCKSSRPFMATGMFGVTVERILVDDVPLSFSLTVVKLAWLTAAVEMQPPLVVFKLPLQVLSEVAIAVFSFSVLEKIVLVGDVFGDAMHLRWWTSWTNLLLRSCDTWNKFWVHIKEDAKPLWMPGVEDANYAPT